MIKKICTKCGKHYNDVYEEEVSVKCICFRCYLDEELDNEDEEE